VIALLAVALLGAAPSGIVFDDANGDGRRGAGERGLAGVVVSDGRELALSDAEGGYRLAESSARNVFVVVPGERRAVGGWYKAPGPGADFALALSPLPEEWRFAHLSDTHIHAGNVERTRAAFRLARERGAAFALVTGDLIKDAWRADERTAREQFGLIAATVRDAGLPVWSAPGNHDVFGIDREASGVTAAHAAYGKAMFEENFGPRYYAFNRGRVHFLVLDTIGVDDTRYYGFLDADQLDWIRRELAHVAPDAPVVTLGHIPLRSGTVTTFYSDDVVLSVGGEPWYRHVVRNGQALAEVLKGRDWTLALQGHTHKSERLRQWEPLGAPRYHTAPAVDLQTWGERPTAIFLYTVRGGVIDDGERVVMDEPGDAR
jgi:predicted MPP superfamily phosphohydrolase